MSTIFNVRNIKLPHFSKATVILTAIVLVVAVGAAAVGWNVYKKLTTTTVTAYFPQTLAGVGAGCLLVFILSIGYYITPALLGSPNDQMVSYFVAFYTNTTINWGMATALGGLLLLATLLLYIVYNWLVGADRLKLG